MTALDVCEAEIIRALEKDGWRIAEKPFALWTTEHVVLADFSIHRNHEHVVVLEVKCFANPDNDLSEFYTAVGQYRFYHSAMTLSNVTYPLYLAVPLIAFERLTLDDAMRDIFTTIRLVIVDIDKEEITRWLS